jgi:hypothetical protein
MQPEQVAVAFKHFFAMDLNVREAREMSNLTPGDFAVVCKKMKFLGVCQDSSQLIDLLCQEVEAKNEIKQRQLGFTIN